MLVIDGRKPAAWQLWLARDTGCLTRLLTMAIPMPILVLLGLVLGADAVPLLAIVLLPIWFLGLFFYSAHIERSILPLCGRIEIHPDHVEGEVYQFGHLRSFRHARADVFAVARVRGILVLRARAGGTDFYEVPIPVSDGPQAEEALALLRSWGVTEIR